MRYGRACARYMKRVCYVVRFTRPDEKFRVTVRSAYVLAVVTGRVYDPCRRGLRHIDRQYRSRNGWILRYIIR